MTRLHIVIDVPDEVDAASSDPVHIATDYFGALTAGMIESAEWDAIQVPSRVVPDPDAQSIMLAHTHTALFLMHGGAGHAGYILPGFGTLQMGAHYRQPRQATDGYVTFVGPSTFSHATFAGQTDPGGGYGFSIGSDPDDVADKLLAMAREHMGWEP